MGVIATAAKMLIKAGVTGDELIEALAKIEDAGIPQPVDNKLWETVPDIQAYERERKRKYREKSRQDVPDKTHIYVVEDVEGIEEERKKESRGCARGAATRVPDDFEITDGMWAWAHENNLSPEWVAVQTENFVDYWRAASGQRARKCDWIATWRNWMRSSSERAQKVPTQVQRGRSRPYSG